MQPRVLLITTDHAMTSISVRLNMEKLEKLQEKALCSCHIKMKEKINLTELIPFLREQDLLTKDEKYCLQSKPWSPAERVDYLIDILPKKSYGWWDRLIDSLEKSSSGTAHHELAGYLERELRNLDSGSDINPSRSTPDEMTEQMSDYSLATPAEIDDHMGSKAKRPTRTSIHTASGITQSMCAVGDREPIFV